MRNHNHKRRSARDSFVVRFGAFMILGLLAAISLPSLAAHPESIVCLGILGITPIGMQFFDADRGTGGGWGDLDVKDFQGRVGKALDDVETQSKTLADQIGKAATAEELTKLQTDHDALVEDMKNVRKAQLASRTNRTTVRGQVSEECARNLGVIALLAAVRQGHITEQSRLDSVQGMAKDILGVEFKAAISATDIPLPTEFSGEVIELVSLYGTARQFGTVYPLGAGTVQLPKLKTSPAFGLIAMSATIAEKNPQIEFVAFAAQKWGGLIRLPSEIDEDSIVAIGQFVARYAAREMGKCEDNVFWNADGTNIFASLKGIAKNVVLDGETVSLPSAKTKFSDATLANFRSLRAQVSDAALSMGAYYMHPSFEQHLSGLNTAGDKPYVANAAQGATLDGFKINWISALPAYSTGANAAKVFAVFGDVSYEYLGVRGGMRFDTSREAGFVTDEVLVRALERFTIGKMANGAFAGLITASS